VLSGTGVGKFWVLLFPELSSISRLNNTMFYLKIHKKKILHDYFHESLGKYCKICEMSYDCDPGVVYLPTS
jgi:hypothetical protein